MTGIQKTLLAIVAFVLLAVGTFVYFIANWDPAKAQPVAAPQIPFISPEKLRGPALVRHWSDPQSRRQRPSPALATRTTA